MQRTIELNGITVPYELTRKKVKNINVRINKNGKMSVSCGQKTSINYVEDFLRSKSDFILRAMNKAKARLDNKVRPEFFVTNEEVCVYGKKCIIKLYRGDVNKVFFSYPNINLVVKDPTSYEIRKRTYETWKNKQIKNKVLELCKSYYPVFESKGVLYPKEIKFRTMTSKWGCCRPQRGTLTFNNNLFEVPLECIEYVVVHEFAHFLEANHSARFYNQVANVLPDYKAREKLLNEF